MAATMTDYEQATTSAAVFDLSARGKVELAGADAVMFLHNLCTNDIKNLPTGGGCEAFLTTAKAKVIAHFLVGRFQQLGRASHPRPVVLLDLMPGGAEQLLQQLDRYLISEQVELANRTSEIGLLRLTGPRAAAVLAGTAANHAEELDRIPHLHHISWELGEIPVQVRRHDLLRIPAYDVFCSMPDAAAVAKTLGAAGVTPGSAATHEVLRIEAGLPEYGVDIDENRLVMEVNRTREAICYTKGCYLGQEPIVMARDRGHVNRHLLRIKVAGEELPGSGARVFHGDEEVGQVTSSTWSPRLHSVLALAYLKRGHQDPGRPLTIETEAGRRNAEVV